jgi:hypothetical protein
MAVEIVRVIVKLFAHSDRLTHSVESAESQIKGLLILKDRALIVAALGDLAANFMRIGSEAATAVGEVNSVMREMEESKENGENGL